MMRHLITALSVAACAAGTPLRAQEPGASRHLFLLRFGLTYQEDQPWDGTIASTAGSISRLEGWRFQETDTLLPGNAWRCTVRDAIPTYRQRFGLLYAVMAREDWVLPNGIFVTYAGPSNAELRVQTAQGHFAFRPADVLLGAPLSVLNGQASVERLPVSTVLSGAEGENDHAALAVGPDGTVWVVWQVYRQGADEILARACTGDTWSDPMPVSPAPGDYFKPVVAVDAGGVATVVWSAQEQGNWDLYGRSFAGGIWSAVERLTTAPGPDIFAAVTADRAGGLWLTWQGARDGQWDILLKQRQNQRWTDAVQVSPFTANDWEPALATAPDGTVWVAWDGYEAGDYNVYLRGLRGGHLLPVVPVTTSARFEAQPSVACDAAGRVWVAWNEDYANWGKDWGFMAPGQGNRLYGSRTLNVVCYDNGVLKEPAADLYAALPAEMHEYAQLPALTVDGHGRLWLLFRYPDYRWLGPNYWEMRGLWKWQATCYLGDRWLPVITLPNSTGRDEMRLGLGPAPDGDIRVAWASDGRNYSHPLEDRHQVYTASLHLRDPAGAPPALRPYAPKVVPVAPTHPAEAADVQRIAAHQVTLNGKTYHLYRGDLHRHTEISRDGHQDASLHAAYRYAADAARLDFLGVTDHYPGSSPYDYYRTQKSADLFLVPGGLTPLFSYERSVRYPNGHRNVIYARRGETSFPVSREEAQGREGAGKLFQYLRQTQGISIPHSIGGSMGTDWRDNDPVVEPIVEIYQGLRSSYEYPGAPRAYTKSLWESEDSAQLRNSWHQDKGYMWSAWAKGYKLGVIASSDHRSTHMSFAFVYAESRSREHLLEAMRQRHTYGATDNILLDYRMSDPSSGRTYLMGDVFATAGRPTLQIGIHGTSPLNQVDVIRSEAFVYTTRPPSVPTSFSFTDTESLHGEYYYYVRVIQQDGQLAWSSPIWVRYE